MSSATDFPARPYDVLISSAGPDEDFALGVLAAGLTAAGVSVHHRRLFVPGRPILFEMERAIEQSRFIVPVITPAYLNDDFTTWERLLGQHMAIEDRQRRIIPLIYKNTELPPLLRLLTAVDCTDRADWNQALERLCRAVGHRPAEAPEKPMCPYPGLSPFTERDHRHFFGRTEEVDKLIDVLALTGRAILIGPSGSGKSSLVFAGLVPQLGSSTRLSRHHWTVHTVRPGQHRSAPLAEALVRTRQDEPGGRRLLIVDQLEELFALDPEDRRRFAAELHSLLRDDACSAIATMRADFYGDLLASTLWPVFKDHRVEIVPLDRTALEQAIRRPASEVGVYVETELAHKLVDDAAGEPGMMPLVQETMRSLWDRLEWRFLPLSAYVLPRHTYGEPPRTGLHRALESHAEAAYGRLSSAQQHTAFRLFVRLVQPVPGRGHVRRQRTVRHLAEIVDDPAVLRTTIAALVRARLLTSSAPSADPDNDSALPAEVYIDLAHEALIAGWSRLGRWIDEIGRAEVIRLRLEAKATEWQNLDRRGGLLDALELVEAQRWQATQEAQRLGTDRSIRDLMEVSAAALTEQARLADADRRRRLTIRNRWIIAVSTVAAAALVAAFVAYRNGQEAIRNAQDAKATELAAVAGSLSDQSLDLALLLSVEAYSRKPAPESVAALVTNLARAPALERILHGHDEEVRAVAVAPDGSTVASAGRDDTIVLWDRRGNQIRRMVGHTDEVHGLAFSPDGSVLVSSSDDRTIRRWRLETGEQIGSPSMGHTAEIRGIAVDPSGRWMASAGHDGTVRLWDLATGTQLQQFTEHTQFVLDVAFDATGNRLASAGQDGRVVVRQVTGAGGAELEFSFGTPARAVSFNPTVPTQLAVALNDGTLRMWNSAEPAATPEILLDQPERLFDVAFSTDGTRLAAAGRDQSIAVVELEDRQIQLLVGHAGDVRALAFGPDSGRLVSGSRDTTVMLWDVDRQQRLTHSALPRATPMTLRYSTDGSQVMSVDEGGVVEVFDAATGSTISSVLLADPGELVTAALSADGTMVATGSADGAVAMWHADTGARAWGPVHGHEGNVGALAFAGHGGLLASAGAGPSIMIWDSATGMNRHVFDLDFAASDVAFGPGDRSAIATDANGTLWGWPLTADPDRRQLSDNRIRSVRIGLSPDGESLVVATSQDQIEIRRIDSLLETSTVSVIDHIGSVDGLAVGVPGRIAVSDGERARVNIWDLDSGRLLAALPVRAPATIALSPDRSSVAVATEGRVEIWDLRIEHLLNAACELANRDLTENEWTFYIGEDHERTCPATR